VHVLSLVELRRLESLAPDEPVVSSSAVRAALAAGDVHAAAECLGRPYRLVLLEEGLAGPAGGDQLR
jgi:FAD synthase